jgi:hypothetical protein
LCFGARATVALLHRSSATSRATITAQGLVLEESGCVARNAPCLLLTFKLDEFLDEALEEFRRQETVVDPTVVILGGAKVETWPCELVELVQNDPRTLAVESKVSLHRQGNFNSDGGIARSAVCNRRYRYALSMPGSVLRFIDGENDGTGPVLATLDQPPLGFFGPEIRVRDDKPT